MTTMLNYIQAKTIAHGRWRSPIHIIGNRSFGAMVNCPTLLSSFYEHLKAYFESEDDEESDDLSCGNDGE